MLRFCIARLLKFVFIIILNNPICIYKLPQMMKNIILLYLFPTQNTGSLIKQYLLYKSKDYKNVFMKPCSPNIYSGTPCTPEHLFSNTIPLITFIFRHPSPINIYSWTPCTSKHLILNTLNLWTFIFEHPAPLNIHL